MAAPPREGKSRRRRSLQGCCKRSRRSGSERGRRGRCRSGRQPAAHGFCRLRRSLLTRGESPRRARFADASWCICTYTWMRVLRVTAASSKFAALVLSPRSERPLVRARTTASVLALAHTGRSQRRRNDAPDHQSWRDRLATIAITRSPSIRSPAARFSLRREAAALDQAARARTGPASVAARASWSHRGWLGTPVRGAGRPISRGSRANEETRRRTPGARAIAEAGVP